MVEQNAHVETEEYDELKYRSDSSISKVLGEDEQILLTTSLYKYNRKLKRQERSIMITTKAIYNINKQELFASFISVFNSNFKIRRRIDFTKLTAISVSNLSSEFVLHIADEYDYRYASPNSRDKILKMLCKGYYLNVTSRPLTFYFLKEVNLIRFTTTKDDKKNDINRLPQENALQLDDITLKETLDRINKRKAKVRADTVSLFHKGSVDSVSNRVTLDDFDILKVLGKGAFGKVMLVEKKDTKQFYAMKSLHKEKIIDKDQIEHTKTERYVLERSKCSFLVNLEYAFQTPDKIFFVMKFMRGGELFQHLRMSRRFEEKRAKFYAAEILLGIQALHTLGVVYRDLKPENILMDEEGHLCITDYGMTKRLNEGEITKSFVGTPEYLAPEVIRGKGHGKAVDWWALGIIIYEMLIGISPFYSRERNLQQLFLAICTKDYSFDPKVKMSEDAKDIITKLLLKDPTQRIGYNGPEEVKSHPWFKEIDWNQLSQRKIAPPFKPKISNDQDVRYFDVEFTSENACNSLNPETNMGLVNKYQEEFEGFSYVNPSELNADDK